MREPNTEHHVWCNFFMRPREGCRMCDGPNGNDGLWALYPLDEGMSEDELMAKHFPGNIKR